MIITTIDTVPGKEIEVSLGGSERKYSSCSKHWS